MVDTPRESFVVAKNPDGASSLPYLVRLPIDGGLILKARDTWPTTARVYCHPHAGGWPADAEIVEEVPIVLCRRRGPAVDLVLDRARLDRSQFVFTQLRGRSAIFWQTQTVAKKANPGGRVPKRRALTEGFTIHVDTREKYPFRFAGRDVTTERVAVTAGDYGVRRGDDWLAVVERKSIEDLIGSLSTGTLAFQLARLAELPVAAVVVEGRYPALFDVPRVKDGGWLPDVLARLQLRYREIPIMFADSRKFAEEWTYRFLATSLADLGEAADVDRDGSTGTRSPAGFPSLERGEHVELRDRLSRWRGDPLRWDRHAGSVQARVGGAGRGPRRGLCGLQAGDERRVRRRCAFGRDDHAGAPGDLRRRPRDHEEGVLRCGSFSG